MNVFIGLFGSSWIVGEKGRTHGVNLLISPLLYIATKDQMVVMKLPGAPESIPLDAAFFNYAVKDEQLLALYTKATTKIDVVSEPLVKLVR